MIYNHFMIGGLVGGGRGWLRHHTPAFITRWKTNNTGSSSSKQINLPLPDNGTYNFLVNWGDNSSSTITAWNQAETTHLQYVRNLHRYNHGHHHWVWLRLGLWEHKRCTKTY